MKSRANPESNFKDILAAVDYYYSEKIKVHGATAKGVDWNSCESQRLRFFQLLKLFDTKRPFSINDYGCGYGALIKHMIKLGFEFQYCGYDISSSMISVAKELNEGLKNCLFFIDEERLTKADYTVASGIFNVKLQTGDEKWKDHILQSLARISELSKKGFAFNMLTTYSDPPHMKNYLYYGDPCFFFDYCKSNFSKDVALLHNYGLYEFTIIVQYTTSR